MSETKSILRISTKKPLYYLVALLFLAAHLSHSQEKNETNYYSAKKAQLSKNKGEALVEIAKSFIGKPYTAYTLEEKDQERLIVNLNEFDCTTLVEQSIAILNSKDFDSFKTELRKLRYRNASINGYGSRLHYLTDWLICNEENRNLSLESKKMGGEVLNKPINFMSNNWGKYSRADSEKIKIQILNSEKNINNHPLYYIPKANIPKIEHLIKNGDIIAITTSIQGLDCSHQGIAVWQKGHLHLLHASSSKKKVIISSENLSNYLSNNKLQTGIMIARLQ